MAQQANQPWTELLTHKQTKPTHVKQDGNYFTPTLVLVFLLVYHHQCVFGEFDQWYNKNCEFK